MNTRLEFAQYLKSRGLVGDGVEIGVMFGEFSKHMLSNWPGRLFMIDPWENQPPSRYLDGCNSLDMDKAMQRAIDACMEFGKRAVIVREYSVMAAKNFQEGQLDWVFLDGNHRYESVKADLNAYWGKLHSGAIMAGHDFYERHTDWHDCGVETAVREFAMRHKLKLNIIPDVGLEPSWWFDKP